MKYLLVKGRGNTFKIYSPDIFGLDTYVYGASSQESIIKKKKHWYMHFWSAGNDWIEETNESYKLNVVLETADIDEILTYIINKKVDRRSIETLLTEARELYTKYIEFVRWTLPSEE